MGYKARQTSDARGYRPITTGLFVSELSACPIGEQRKSVWGIFHESWVAVAVHDLIQVQQSYWNRFNLLANHLVMTEELHPEWKVYVGTTNKARILVTRWKQYREYKGSIYMRRIENDVYHAIQKKSQS